DLDGVSGFGRVELDLSLDPARRDTLGNILETKNGGHGHLEPRRNALARRLGLGTLPGGLELRGQRSADAGLAVTGEKAAHLEPLDRDQAGHSGAAPAHALFVHRHLEGAG